MCDSFEILNDKLVNCRKCPRLVAWREEMAATKRRAYLNQDYWGKPVPGFGDPQAKVVVVGLAPGAHGSNRTGRMFTGDASGDFLYPALFNAGFASQPSSHAIGDGLSLSDVFISAVCRCVPPGNKPTAEEISICLPWLQREVDLLSDVKGCVALGRIAFDGILQLYKMQGVKMPNLKFSHGAFFQIGGLPWILCTYHPSRQNTQTGRLTVAMFDEIWSRVKDL